MPHIDGIYYYGADADPQFIKIADKLDACPRFAEFHTCQRCPDFRLCEWKHRGLCNKSLRRKLEPREVREYRNWLRQRIGVTICTKQKSNG